MTQSFDPNITYLYTIFGEPVTSFLQVHSHCKILVASSSREFKGLTGLDKFMHMTRPEQPVELIRPRPDTWV